MSKKGKDAGVVEAASSKAAFSSGPVVSRDGWRNLLAFWILGLCNNYGYVVMLSAAHDILALNDDPATEHKVANATTRDCNELSTGAILLADILPSVAVKLIAPFLPFMVHARMMVCVTFSAAGLLLVSQSGGMQILAIVGVVITSLSSGLGEVTILSYSHRYTKNVISTWSSGTGGPASSYELIDFRNFSLEHKLQYRILQMDYQIGVFLSRSSINFLSVDKIWIMSVLQFINVVIMTFEAIYYYIPTIWIVFALVLWEGLLGGAAYVNTFYRMTKEVPWEKRQVALGIASMSDSFGIAIAGWLAMPVHNQICNLPLPQRLGS
ncbi:unnamed protein product [Trichogramma brassicae]|uniref:Battenin n=1 Tax=Trichogramma brassicae TaxID=86971 RepID=A0A6H5IPV4_9HYME|nr:unnamed protein product [Trichogramma brassicae]